MKTCSYCGLVSSDTARTCDCGRNLDGSGQRTAPELPTGSSDSSRGTPATTVQQVPGGYGCFTSGFLVLGAVRAMATMAATATNNEQVLASGRVAIFMAGALGLGAVLAIYLRKLAGFYVLVGLNLAINMYALLVDVWHPVVLVPFVSNVVFGVMLHRAGFFSPADHARPLLLAVLVSLAYLFISVIAHGSTDVRSTASSDEPAAAARAPYQPAEPAPNQATPRTVTPPPESPPIAIVDVGVSGRRVRIRVRSTGAHSIDALRYTLAFYSAFEEPVCVGYQRPCNQLGFENVRTFRPGDEVLDVSVPVVASDRRITFVAAVVTHAHYVEGGNWTAPQNAVDSATRYRVVGR